MKPGSPSALHSKQRQQGPLPTKEPKLASTRRAYGETLVQLGHERNDFVVFDADIAKSTHTYMFAQAFPDRFFNMGVAEQNAAGFAAGLSTTGLIAVVSSYAVFVSMRMCEQIRTSICYPNLNVKFVASHGGLATAIDGVSHQGTEDLAILRSLPNMTVIAPADDPTTRRTVRAILDHPGPCYVRLIRDPVPVVYDRGLDDFRIGKGIVLRDGRDVTLIAAGIMVAKALEAGEQLAPKGVGARVIDMHTLKPIDKDLICRCAQETGALVTYEDNTINGGLGSAVAEVLVENVPVPMERIGLRDTFGESGKRELLFDKYGMNVSHVVAAAERVIARK